MNTIRLTMGQALVKFMDNQYLSMVGEEHKYINGVFGIFGHGCVLGIGEALQEKNHSLPFYQGHNEQGMAHAAIAYAKQNKRKKIMAVTSSIGPGALNMVTAAGLATVNRIPVLLLPGDVFAGRQPDPVLQQVEQFYDYSITANDAFKAVCRYWDRINRPEQIMSALLQAMRVLTDPADTGAVCLSIPQDVQAEAWNYPLNFFRKRLHYIEPRSLNMDAAKRAAGLIAKSKKPLLICGGGVRYADADDVLARFTQKYNIPLAETQAGKSVLTWDHPMNLGGIGVTGTLAANSIAREADLIIAVGTRLSDFTTASKSLFKNSAAQFLSLNVCPFDASKLDAESFICDAKLGLVSLDKELSELQYQTAYTKEIAKARKSWEKEVDRLYSIESDDNEYSQLRALGLLNRQLLPADAVIVGASGSLPGDLQRLWRPKKRDTYHLEYGFSCMGYEVCGGVGVKMAAPDKEVYVMVGDGSFIMLHSELLTSIQENLKINVLLFDNSGFGCIDNLQTSQGIPKFGCELRYKNNANENNIPVDYVKIAEGYGCRAWMVTNSDELTTAIAEARKSPISTVIVIKVGANSMSEGYESWWRVGVPEVSEKASVLKAHKVMLENIAKARQV